MKYILAILFIMIEFSMYAQKSGKSVIFGNVYYNSENYEEAEVKYREALEKEPDFPAANYNLGNTNYKQEEYETAIERYKDAINSTDNPGKLSKYNYNLGNAYFKKEKYKESIEAYKNALRNNPKNENARHNLFLAQKYLKQQQQQQQQQQKNKDGKPPEPSEYAKQLKKQAQELVNLRRYSEAYNLMIEGEKKDPTVAAFRSFTDKIKEVDDINNI